MPNRILKESICTSDNLDRLSAEEERFFYRLIVQVDDFGRFDARPPILRAACFPLKIDSMTDADIVRLLDALVRADLMILYTVGGRSYLQLTTWDAHQQRRAQTSKYPSPDGFFSHKQTPASTRNQVQSDVGNGLQPLSNVPVNVNENVNENVNGNRESGDTPHSSSSTAAPQELDPTPTRRPSTPRAPNAAYELAAALAEVCHMDLAANKGRLLKEAKLLSGAQPPPTPELVRQHYGPDGWWWRYDWRGQRNEPPQPTAVRETWNRWSQDRSNGSARPAMGDGNTSQGARLSPAQQAAWLVLEEIENSGEQA